MNLETNHPDPSESSPTSTTGTGGVGSDSSDQCGLPGPRTPDAILFGASSSCSHGISTPLAIVLGTPSGTPPVSPALPEPFTPPGTPPTSDSESETTQVPTETEIGDEAPDPDATQESKKLSLRERGLLYTPTSEMSPVEWEGESYHTPHTPHWSPPATSAQPLSPSPLTPEEAFPVTVDTPDNQDPTGPVRVSEIP